MRVTRKSPFTQKVNFMDLAITAEQVVRWDKGELIQDVFPHLTPDEREFIQTGITPEDWNEMVGETEEMYDEEDY
jgi:hypothetical protein